MRILSASSVATVVDGDGGLFLQATLLPSRRRGGVDTYIRTKAEIPKVVAAAKKKKTTTKKKEDEKEKRERGRQNFLLQAMRRRVGRYK